MERAKEYIERFKKDPNRASDLLDAKETYRKAKIAVLSLFFLFYAAVVVLNALEFSETDLILQVTLGGIGVSILIDILIMVVLYLNIRGYDYSDEELVYHELARAIEEYLRDATDYSAWENHLNNMYILLDNHENEAFSKARENKIREYIKYVKSRNADDISKSKFEKFGDLVLNDILDEHENGLSEVLEDLETPESDESGGHMDTIISSLENLWKRWNLNRWMPVIAALVIGISVFYLVEEQLGYLLTTALLTIILIAQNQRQ